MFESKHKPALCKNESLTVFFSLLQDFQHNPEYAPTLEECDAIELTNTLDDAMKLIPEDKKEFFGLIDRTYGVAMTKATSREELRAMILKLAQKDSKLAIQLATYLQMLDLVAEI